MSARNTRAVKARRRKQRKAEAARRSSTFHGAEIDVHTLDELVDLAECGERLPCGCLARDALREMLAEPGEAPWYLPDGRHVYGKAEVYEVSDPDLPCPDCGQAWKDHPGEVEMRVVDGRAGFVWPKCPTVGEH